jgi:parallel beta-helix repeat protein
MGFETTTRAEDDGLRAWVRRGLGAGLAATALLLVPVTGAHAKKAVAVSCGETITADTKLANDLTDCPGDGIVIGADDIRLDLNAHTVDGDDDRFGSADSGIDNTAGHEGVTIKGGSIREFVEGVEVDGARDNIVRDLATSRNSHAGIFVSESTDVRVKKNSVFTNIAGIVVADASDVRVEHNTVSDSVFGAAIPVFRSDHVLVADNSATGSAASGVFLNDSENSRVERNDVSGNETGIFLDEGSAGNVLVGNDAIGNTFDGVVLEVGTHDNLVTNNLLRANGFSGVFVVGSDDNRIENNSVIANGEGSVGGIHLFVPPEEPGLTSNDNVISNNRLVATDGDGVLVDAGQSGNVIEGNRASENTDDGIDVDSSATTLTANTADDNHDLGIEAVPGVTDGAGNKASGNGNPLQCTNVFCG